MKKIQLLLIEDNRLLHSGILEILKKQDDIKIIAVMGNNKKHVKTQGSLTPDIILLDFSLRNQNSLQFVESIKK